jgi:fructokinase
MSPLVGAIEAGGTKFNCAVGTGPDDLRAEIRIATTTPSETFDGCIRFFREQEPIHGKLDAIGIASFGPVDLHPTSPTYGFITSTPKPGWHHTEIAGVFKREFNVPVGFDTDVNGAALAEHRWGAARGLENIVYLTVGTGIGGGAYINGQLLHGMLHPEMGHFIVSRHPDDIFKGHCPYHGGCLEGMASGPAMKARTGQPAEILPSDHLAWDWEAYYLAQAAVACATILSPQRIVMGGGMLDHAGLIEKIRHQTSKLFNGYLQMPQVTTQIDQYIVKPGLGSRAGVLGALALGLAALR